MTYTFRSIPGLPTQAQSIIKAMLDEIDSEGISSVLDVVGVQRWWDPELSDYSAGTWQDLTGKADLTQPNVSFRPTLNPTGLNDKPSLTFDGIDNHLFNVFPLLASLDKFTLIVIGKASSGQIGRHLVTEGSSISVTPVFSAIRAGSATRSTSPSGFIRNDANTVLFENSTGALAFDDTVNFFGTMVDTTANQLFHFEDVEIDDPDDYTETGALTVDRFAIGAQLGPTAQSQMAAEVGPVIIVDRVLTSAELRQIRDYYVTRGYLDAYQPDQVTPAVPAGYTLVYNEDFSTYGGDISQVVENGQVATQGLPFADSYVTFGVRFLVGNNDRCYKGLAGDVGSGSTALSDLIGVLPHEIANNNLILRFGEIPPGDRANFLNLEHGGGMISSERSFAHGPGFFEVRARIKNNPPGGHLAIWLLTQNTNPHDLEIDLVEIVGNNQTSADKPMNSLFYNGHNQQGVLPGPLPLTQDNVSNFTLNDWQTYGFLYETDRFRWFRNGVEVRDEPAYFDDTSPLYFLVTWDSNFDDADDFPGPADGNSPIFPAEVEVDYLRVYAPPSGG